MNSKLSFSWDLYQNSICNGFSSLQQLGEFVDMTLAADGHFVKVHQTLIALSSPYLRALIKTVPTQHPVIFLDNVCHNTLCYLLEYIYTGEVAVPRDKLYLFTRAAKALCLTGIENILEKNKELQEFIEPSELDDNDEKTTNTVKMEPLPTALVPQAAMSNEDQDETNDNYFQPHADTIEIDIESELNIPYNTNNKNIFNTSDDFENTVRQIPTPLLTPSGNNLGSLVNLRSPMPQLTVSPNDFNCDSNASFQMDQFLKGLNLSNDDNAQKVHNSSAEFINGHTNVLDFTVEPICQKSMPLIDISAPSDDYNMSETINVNNAEISGKGYKSFKRLFTEDSIHYEESSVGGKGFKRIRSLDDNNIGLSPLMELIDGDNGDVGTEPEPVIPAEIDNHHSNIEDLILMPILDNTTESGASELPGNELRCVQKASQIKIMNTGEVFVKPLPIKKSSTKTLRDIRKNKSAAASDSASNISESDGTLNFETQEAGEIQMPSVCIHIPETQENIDFFNGSELEMPRIEIKLPETPIESSDLNKFKTDLENNIPKPKPPLPCIKIKIPEKHGTENVKTSDIIKGVTTSKSKMVHGIQILKVAENLSKTKSENELSVETTPSSGIQRITIQKQQLVKIDKPVRKIKRIHFRKAKVSSQSPLNSESEPTEQPIGEERKPLGFQFRLPDAKQRIEPLVTALKGEQRIAPLETACSEENDQETTELVEEKDKTSEKGQCVQITHKGEGDSSSSAVNFEFAANISTQLPDLAGAITYSVSRRGSLQIIVNRYLYYSHYRTGAARRRWRCTSYRYAKCSAYIDTEGNLIVSRVNPHNHPFHDRKILQRVKNNEVFSVISEAEDFYRKKQKIINDQNSDSDSDK